MRGVVPCLVALALAGGCARYEYDLVHPPELARSVPRDAEEQVILEPLEYHLRTVENRLVMWIANPTEQSIQLVGAQSSIVDPAGQSRPVAGRNIAPNSYIKFIFPPMRSAVGRPGPAVGFGVGTGIGRARGVGTGVGVGVPIGGRPRPVYLDDPVYLWEWPGESSVRMIFHYRQEDRTFTHEFEFERRRVR